MLSQTRFTQILDSQSAIARKVFDCVPIAEHWSMHQVAQEMQRRGYNHEYRVVQGCLGSLVDAGLVQEPERGTFCRAPCRPIPPKPTVVFREEKMTATTATVKLAPPAPAASPIDKIGALAARMAQMGDELKQLASDVGDAALEVQGQIEQAEAHTQQLRQLQTLLKNLSLG